MALRLAARKMARWGSPGGARAAGGSCSGPRAPPPCPAPRPAPRPACRAPPPAARPAARLVCRPPPPAARPPCAPPEPACPLTCDRAAAPRASSALCHSTPSKTQTAGTAPRSVPGGECCAERDFVARRLALAKEARRADYEREVAACAGPRRPRPPPRAPYSLGDERQDPARLAAAPAASAASPEPDNACGVRGEPRLDPCAHRPRVTVEIERAARPAPPPRPEPGTRPDSPPLSARGIASRLMSGLKLTREPRTPKVEPQAAGGSRCAGDSGWCASPPPAPATPAACRRPTAAERLRPPPRHPGRGARGLHSSAATRAPVPDSVPSSKPVDGMAEVVRARSKFEEAGRGRVAADPSCGGAEGEAAAGAGGGLELRVPPGAGRVRVRVTVDGAASPPARPCSPAEPSAPGPPGPAPRVDRSRCLASTPSPGNDSWLSIKSIQKKLAGCRKTQETPPSAEKKKTPSASTPPSKTSPCGPSPSVSPPPAGPPGEAVSPRGSPSPCPPKRSEGRCGPGGPRGPAAPVCPPRHEQSKSEKAPRGPARFSSTLGLLFNTI